MNKYYHKTLLIEQICDKVDRPRKNMPLILRGKMEADLRKECKENNISFKLICKILHAHVDNRESTNKQRAKTANL